MASVSWVRVDHGDEEPVSIGDLVSADAGGMPTYQVMRFSDGQVWLSGEHRQTVLVRPLDVFRWKAAVH